MKNLINGQKPEFGNLEQIKILQKAEREIAEDEEYKVLRRNMSPMEKYIDDLSSIDWVRLVIENKVKKITEKLSGRSPMDIAIDKATGYEKSLIKAFLVDLREGYKELIKLYRRTEDEVYLARYKKHLAKLNKALSGEYKHIEALKID